MEKEAYCRWHDKPLIKVAEHEQEWCYEKGMQCEDCDNLVIANSGKEEQEGMLR